MHAASSVPASGEGNRLRAGDESYDRLLARLCHQSVVKHFDAYADVPWDDPAYRIDPADPRWELPEDDPLGATAWYRGLPPPRRARLGLHLWVTFMKVGIQFENVLQRGLLEFALTLPDGAPEFRYAYHELIEEGQHSLMFQEFINRAGLPVTGIPAVSIVLVRRVVRFARTFPELFFVFVLAGEEPIDYIQRTALGRGRVMHPLLKRTMQIHVVEEARHLCFARQYLREHAPRLGSLRRRWLMVRAPLTLAIMINFMTRPSSALVREYGIPRDVMRAVYRDGLRHRARVIEALGRVRQLCWEVGLATPRTAPLWSRLGLAASAR